MRACSRCKVKFNTGRCPKCKSYAYVRDNVPNYGSSFDSYTTVESVTPFYDTAYGDSSSSSSNDSCDSSSYDSGSSYSDSSSSDSDSGSCD